MAESLAQQPAKGHSSRSFQGQHSTALQYTLMVHHIGFHLCIVVCTPSWLLTHVCAHVIAYMSNAIAADAGARIMVMLLQP